MKKVFLGIRDNNYNFVNRFLERFDHSYDLTLGIFSSRFEYPKHDKIVNLNFVNQGQLSKYEKISFFEELIKGFDLVVSNNFYHLSKASHNLSIKYIQYSDIFFFHELLKNKEVLFGKLAKSNLRMAVLSPMEQEVYALSAKNYSCNPLVFFHNFEMRNSDLLQPYYKKGNPQEENENLVISYSAHKKLLTKRSVNLSSIEDFGYTQFDLNSQEYYDLLTSSQNIKIDLDYLLLGDCLLNNIRPEIYFLNKNVNNYYLYNFARVLNLSKVVESIPFMKLTDEQLYPTLDQTILEHL